MSDEQTKQTEFDPCEQALRDHADMIEKSCSETPQLRRRIKRLRKAADRLQSLTAEVERLRKLVPEAYQEGFEDRSMGLEDAELCEHWPYSETIEKLKEAADG